MKEMNREMELNMDELEQVNGGIEFCIGVAGFDLDVPDYTPDYCQEGISMPVRYCEMGISLPETL